MNEIGYYKIDELVLREPPARDACFKVVTRDVDMHEVGDMSQTARREILHRHMTNEMTSVDMAASCVAEFPDAPWELRMELARQCYDETRHVRALYRRLAEIGGYKGEFPISAFEWCVTCALDSLPGRVSNLSTRGRVGIGDDVLIGGIIINGIPAKKLVVRAIGPSLATAPFSLSETLSDPTLEVRDASGTLLFSNDNWAAGAQAAMIAASPYRPQHPNEAAIIATLSAGKYTAIVRGMNNTSGIALVDAYDLDP